MNKGSETDILIVGAGLSGLCAAIHLRRMGYRVRILEAEDRVGGRVKTDEYQGYLMDRGFQVLLTAYPECRKMLDYEALDLKTFMPGAMVFNDKGSFTITDPLRAPSGALQTLFSSVGSISDKFRILSLSQRLRKMNLEEIFTQHEKSTLAVIQEYGFSERMLRNFFQPFMAGIFLENGLTTSRREFDFVFKMFAEGDTAVPARGMEMIPRQLAASVGEEHIHCNKKVVNISGQEVSTEDGEVFSAPVILLATDPLGYVSRYLPGGKNAVSYHSTTNVYFSAEVPPINKPLIGLNAMGSKLVNNICVLNRVAPDYAPEGRHLISVSVNALSMENDEQLVAAIKEEMNRWFGQQTQNWAFLRTYRVRYALPNQDSVTHEVEASQLRLREGLYAAGDYLLNGSINAAMRSGRIAADVIKEELVSTV
jgi:phytoene dehydrogenase-like protein